MAYILRVLAADWRRTKDDTEAKKQFFLALARLSGSDGASAAPKSFVQLRNGLRCAPWVEVNMDPSVDRLRMGVALENEAKELITQCRKDMALQTYEKAIAILTLVSKYDSRVKNPNIKDMVDKRIEELRCRATVLKACG